jgi:hypothetical protein
LYGTTVPLPNRRSPVSSTSLAAGKRLSGRRW